MHQVLGHEAATVSTYSPAVNLFEPAEAMQTILLLAQNGLPGLNPDCCLARALMEPHHLDWVSEVFGPAFLDQVDGVAADIAVDPTHLVLFPAHELPKAGSCFIVWRVRRVLYIGAGRRPVVDGTPSSMAGNASRTGNNN